MDKKSRKKFPHMAALTDKVDPDSKTFDVDKQPSPLEILGAAHADAPPMGQSFIESRVMEILMIDLPALQYVVQQGGIVSTDNLASIEEAFAQSMVFADKVMPEVGKSISATLRDIASNIGREVDKGFKRMLLEDKHANRMALLAATAAHAKLVKHIGEIALTEEEKELVNESSK